MKLRHRSLEVVETNNIEEFEPLRNKGYSISLHKDLKLPDSEDDSGYYVLRHRGWSAVILDQDGNFRSTHATQLEDEDVKTRSTVLRSEATRIVQILLPWIVK